MSRCKGKHALQSAYRRSRGLTLVEILVALVVLSIGLLGLAGMQTMSLKYNTSAYYRTLATQLAYDLADRMRANRQAALSGAYAVEASAATCNPSFVPSGSPVERDIAAWRNTLACRIPQSIGSVTPGAGTEYMITVEWVDIPGEEIMTFEFTTAL